MLGPFVGEWDEGLLRGFDGDKVHALVAHVAMCVDRPWTRPTVAEHWGDVDAVVHGGVGAPVLEADAGVLRRLRRRGAGCNQVR